MFQRCMSYLVILAAAAAPVVAQDGPTITVRQAECLPVGDNGVIHADVAGEPGGSTVRVYFRRMHEVVEDFYYVQAVPTGAGKYWAVLPKAEDEILEERALAEALREERQQAETDEGWAEWWKAKEGSVDRDPNDDLDRELIEERASLGKLEARDWMLELDDDALEEWLRNLDYEPTEYFGTIHDANGELVAKSEMKVVQVRDEDECELELTDQQRGMAENMTVGETAPWAEGERVFHWLCDGVVTRIDPTGTLRADEICRICFVAWWERKEILFPAVAAGITTAIVTTDSDPVSPSSP